MSTDVKAYVCANVSLTLEVPLFRFNGSRLVALATMFALLSLVGSAPVSAQILVQKDLCGVAVDPSGTGCILSGSGGVVGQPIVSPGLLADYQITILNSGPGVSVDIQDNLPPGFVLVSTPAPVCVDPNNTVIPLAASPAAPFYGPIALPSGAPSITVCHFYGYFVHQTAASNSAINGAQVYPSGDHGAELAHSNPVNAVVGSPADMPADVSVTKDLVSFTNYPNHTTAHYRIVVTNNGTTDVYGLQLQDQLQLNPNSIALTATYVSGSSTCTVVPSTFSALDCMDLDTTHLHSPAYVGGTNPSDFIQWVYPPNGSGVLHSGESIVFEFDIEIDVPPAVACQIDHTANGLINVAHIGFNIPGAQSTTFESAPGDNTDAADVVPVDFDGPPDDPGCHPPSPIGGMSKTLITPLPAGGAFPWPSVLEYEITLTNNSTTQTIPGFSLNDAVEGGVGTPAFQAQIVAINCPLCTGTTPTPTYPLETVPAYMHAVSMLGTTSPAIPPLSSFTFQVQVEFSAPECDSYTQITPKPVINIASGSYFDPGLGATVSMSAFATAPFDATAACQLQVTKNLANGDPLQITFGNNVHYTVDFANLGTGPITIGTLIDTLRIEQLDYASPLHVDYDYDCSDTGGVTGYPAGPVSAAVSVVYTSYPQQGVRIIQNATPVTFPAGSHVICNVRLRVTAPPVGGDKCARLGLLQNTAIMDTSEFYNPNLPWSTTPGVFGTVSLPLPECFDLIINKSATPSWTTPAGGPFHYDVSVFNNGDDILPTDNVSVSDYFSTAVSPITTWSELCTQPGTNIPLNPVPLSCTFQWVPPASGGNLSTYTVQELVHDWATHGLFDLPGSYGAAPSEICNDARVTVNGAKAEDLPTHPHWYARDPASWTTSRCVGIFEKSDIKLIKIVDLAAGAPMPPPTAFNVDVNCSYGFGNNTYGSSETVSLNWPSPASATTIVPIPLNSTCTIVEHLSGPTYVEAKECPSGWGEWVVPGPATMVANQTSQYYEVHNIFECAKVPPLTVIKKVENPHNFNIAGAQFPIHVACAPAAFGHTFVDGEAFDFTGMAPGSSCQVSENTTLIHSGEKPICPPGLSPRWTVTITPSGIVHPGDEVTVNNLIECVNLEPGLLNVFKTLENGTAGDLSGVQFPVVVSCSTGGPVLLSANQPPVQIGPYANGTVCHIEEDLTQVVLPPNEKLCPNGGVAQWATPSYQSSTSGTSQDVLVNGMTYVIVHNAVRCADPLLTVIKKVDNLTSLSPADLASFQYSLVVKCNGIETTYTVSEGQLLYPNDAVAGTDCTVGEDTSVLPAVDAAKACPDGTVPHWRDPTFTPSDVVHLGEQPVTIYVENVIECVKVTLGSVAASKSVSNQTGVSLAAISLLQFPVTVSCSDGSGTVTTFSANGPAVVVPNLAGGTTCTVSEPLPWPLPPPDAGACPNGQAPQWVTPESYVGGPNVIVNGQNAQVIAVNTLICVGQGVGSVTLVKLVNDLTGGYAPSGMQFTVNMSCGGSPFATSSLLGGTLVSVPNVPVGVSCLITEVPPGTVTVPVPACASGAGWTSVSFAPPSQTVYLQSAGETQTVLVTNTFDCIPDNPDYGGLTITKTCGPALPAPSGQGLEAICQIVVTATGTVPDTIVVNENLQGPVNIPGHENQIVSMTSAQNWSCPAMPLVAGSSGNCTLPGVDLSAAGGQSVITVVIDFNDAGNASETQNCVNVTGLDSSGSPVTTATQVCAGFVSEAAVFDLGVIKQFDIVGPAGPNQSVTFGLVVDCLDSNNQHLPGFPASLSATPVPVGTSYVWSTSYWVPTGGTCSIDEPAPLPTPTGDLSLCSWASGTPVYFNEVFGGTGLQPGATINLIAPNEGGNLIAVNQLICPPLLLAPEPTPTRTFTLGIVQPKPCAPGTECSFEVTFNSRGDGALVGPLFLSSGLPLAIGKNGGDLGDWFCANSDMGSLCTTALEDRAPELPASLHLPILIPSRAGTGTEICFSLEAPSDASPKSLARAVQLGLTSEGYSLGLIDGAIGAKSRAAISAFGKQNGTALSDGGMSDVYRLLFGTAPTSKDGAARTKSNCVMIDLAPQRPVPVKPDPKADEQDGVPAKEPPVTEPDQLICMPPAEDNGKGECVCPDDTKPVKGLCAPAGFQIDLPKLGFPDGVIVIQP